MNGISICISFSILLFSEFLISFFIVCIFIFTDYEKQIKSYYLLFKKIIIIIIIIIVVVVVVVNIKAQIYLKPYNSKNCLPEFELVS